MLASGADIALVSKRLGHSSITITADTYSHPLDGVGRTAAERAVALVPRNRGDQYVTNSAGSAESEDHIQKVNPQVRMGAPRGNRTLHPAD